MRTNSTRAESAGDHIRGYHSTLKEEDPQTDFGDFLADLLHYGHQELGAEFLPALRGGFHHFFSELVDEHNIVDETVHPEATTALNLIKYHVDWLMAIAEVVRVRQSRSEV
jgi:hypothetical protein